MISYDEVEEILPCPVKLEIYCNATHFHYANPDSLKIVLKNHNAKHSKQINSFPAHFISGKHLAMNEFAIYVGENIVHKGKAPEEIDSIADEMDFLKSITHIAEDVLNIWHDRIIEFQEDNKCKIKKYEEEEYDEMLYAYYLIHSDKKAFCYLKKLATRYPNSGYMRKLRSTYRQGLHGWHKKSEAMARKVSKRINGECF